MDWKTYLFSFDGRINRAKFWLVYLVQMIAALPLILAMMLMSGLEQGGGIPIVWRARIFVALAVVIGLAALWPQIAIYVKRLHDRNRSAWWLAIFYGPMLLPLAFFPLVGLVKDPWTIFPFLQLLFLPIMVFQTWGFIELHFLRGTVGDNRYGPDPLAAAD